MSAKGRNQKFKPRHSRADGARANGPYFNGILRLGQGGPKRTKETPGRRPAPGGEAEHPPRRAGSRGAAPWVGMDAAGGPTRASGDAEPPPHRRVGVARTGGVSPQLP